MVPQIDLSVLVNTSEGRLFLILLIMALPRLIDTVRDLIRNRGIVDKAAGELAATEAKAVADERKRQDDLANNLIGVVGSLVLRQDKLIASLDSATAENRIGHTIEAERLKMREAENLANRALIQEQTQAVAGFPPALAASVTAITSQIEQTSVQGVQTIAEKITKMSDELGGKINPVDEHLQQQADLLKALKESVDALTGLIETKLTTVPDRFQDIQNTVDVVKESIEKALGKINDTAAAVNRADAAEARAEAAEALVADLRRQLTAPMVVPAPVIEPQLEKKD